MKTANINHKSGLEDIEAAIFKLSFCDKSIKSYSLAFNPSENRVLSFVGCPTLTLPSNEQVFQIFLYLDIFSGFDIHNKYKQYKGDLIF